MLKVDLDLVELQDNATAGGPIRVAFPFHSAAGSASTAAVLFELEPDSMLASHQDSAEEVLHVLEGEAEAQIGEERGRLRAGQLAIVPAMAPHSLRNIGERTPARARSSRARRWSRRSRSRSLPAAPR